MVLDVNPAYEKITGIRRAEAVGRAGSKLYAAGVAPFLEEYARVAETGVPWHADTFWPPMDKHFHISAFSQRPDHFATVFTDITDWRESTRRLEESENRHRSLFESMLQGVVYQDADGHIIAANRSAERILGLTLDEMTGRTSMDPRWRAVREDGTPFPGEEHPANMALRTGRPVKDMIMGVFNPRREEMRWITIIAVPQFRPGGNRPHQVFTTFIDITRQRESELAGREMTERYKALFERSMDCVHVHDLEGRFIDANPAALGLLGYRKEDAVLLDLSSLMDPASLDQARRDLRKIIKKGRQDRLHRYRVKTAAGERITVETHSVLLYRHGRPYAVQAIARPIREDAVSDNQAETRFRRKPSGRRASGDGISAARRTRGKGMVAARRIEHATESLVSPCPAFGV